MSVEVLEDGRKRISAPLSDDDVRALEIGDVVLVNGTVYAARDAAHKRMVEMLDRGEELPFDIAGQIVYYVGPTPERPGQRDGLGRARPRRAGWTNGRRGCSSWA